MNDAQKQKKTANMKLKEKLYVNQESSWLKFSKDEQKKIFSFAEKYKIFIANSKTERLCVDNIINDLKKSGFKDIENIDKLKPNDKVYKIIKNKAVFAAVVGKKDGVFRIIGSHVDSPRLDLKPKPMYQEADLCLLQSHYYGGIKNYQWVNTPLELYGVVFTKDGRKVIINLGDKEGDPKFIIPDISPHLAFDQMKKEGKKIIEGEELNIICGHIPVNDKQIVEKIKFNILKKLNDEYGIVEEDFYCAEFEFIPAQQPVDIGLDRGLIGAYGQDDRACVYISLKALSDCGKPEHTAVSLWVDKEEVGSTGDTSATSNIILNFFRDLKNKMELPYSEYDLLAKSKAISADTTSAMNPTFSNINDSNNVSYLGRGISVKKYGGTGGKYFTVDAHAEYMHYLRAVLEKNKIPWQTGEIGKIDIGGGGTIGMHMAKYGMDVVDAGPCLLAAHSPCEVASKADIYAGYLFFKAFFCTS